MITMKLKISLIAFTLATTLLVGVTWANNLPDLGDVSQTVLTPLQEQAIAEQILREVAVSDEVVQDIEVTAYLQALGMRLVSGSPDNQLKFNFFVVQDNSINAFAMPGGVVGVHTGLILASNSESELASVLGHEIGHVTQHHLARMLAAQKAILSRTLPAWPWLFWWREPTHNWPVAH